MYREPMHWIWGQRLEVIANEFLDKGADAIVIVLDATNLERNLYLALQVLDRGFPHCSGPEPDGCSEEQRY